MLAWPIIALLIFVLIFVGVLAYVFLGLRDKKKIDDLSQLPFAPESTVDEHSDKKEADDEIDTEDNGRDKTESSAGMGGPVQ